MSTPQAITPEAVTKHVHALLATNVTVKKVTTQEIKGAQVYAMVHDEAGALVCVILTDLTCAGSTGAALSKIPPGAVQDLVRKGELLDEDLLANYQEVANVLTVLTTAAIGRRTILRTVAQSKTPPPAPVLELVKKAPTKVFLQVAVQGYPTGAMNVYLAA
jgi:hypothetical protein